MIRYEDFIDAMNMYGFSSTNRYSYQLDNITCSYKSNRIIVSQNNRCYATRNIINVIEYIESSLNVGTHKIPITAAINTKNLAQNLVRVRSSNVWAIGFNVRKKGDKTGDLIMQFKDKNGGGGHLYIFYNVPIIVYRRMQSAPSIGHFFWVNVRNNFTYSKLTGSKRGVLPNAINNW
jgi:hypothetical protein